MNPRIARIAAITAIFAAGAAHAASPNLVKNGDFSLVDDLSVPVNGYVVVDAGANSISHWTVGKDSVDVVDGPMYNAINGFSIDLIGTPGPGEISQKIKGLQADTSYTLTFDLARNPNADKAAVKVEFLGQIMTFKAPSDNSVTAESFTFLGSALSQASDSQLKFFSIDKGNAYSGAILDNVSVTAAVPEPETYGMLLGGLGLIGFVARRKQRNKAA